MATYNNDDSSSTQHLRTRDPYLDRRAGEDRRQIYSLHYFNHGGQERRIAKERRVNVERRTGYTRVSTWASVCLSPPEQYGS